MRKACLLFLAAAALAAACARSPTPAAERRAADAPSYDETDTVPKKTGQPGGGGN